jgi:hypothetical protein
MKRIFALSMLICFAMICSCQKQDSAAEIQLAQQKADLDAREKELDERLSALDEKVNALAEKEKATLNAQTIPTEVQPQISDPAQVKTERDRAIQQVPAEIRTLIPHDSKMKAESDREQHERRTQTQRGPEDLQRQWQQNLDKAKMSGKAVSPAAEAGSPTPSPAVEANSPSPSPTP